MRRLAALALALAACSPSSTEAPAAPPQYHQDVRPLLERSCGGCHVAGGIGPFVFDEYATAKAMSALISDAVVSRRMPPWMPDTACRHYADERVLADGEVETIRAWHEAGAPEGEPVAQLAAAMAAPAVAEPAPTLTLTGAGAYVPTRERPDDYRCIPLQHTFDRETYLTRAKVLPGVRSQVHHVLLFLIGPQLSAELDRVDLAAEGPGYTCYGGPGIGVPQTIGAWVPGTTGNAIPAGAGIRIPAGARVIMQVHYNSAGGEPQPDQSQVALWLTDVAPAQLVEVRPLAHLGIEIPAGEARSVQSRIYTNRDAAAWRMAGLAGHMHVLGQRIHVRALKASATECLLDIPQWDFSWQQSYRFLPGEEVTIEPGESVRVDCTFDNSAANQPLVNGQKRTPQEVRWGEGTLDEMCLAYITLVKPWSPAVVLTRDETCPGFQACYDGCMGGGAGVAMACALQCSSAARPDRQCTQCVMQSVVACTIDACVTEIDGFLQCLDTCATAADGAGCISRACGPAVLALDACTTARVGPGACDSLSAACDARLSAP